MNTPRVSREQAELLDRLTPTGLIVIDGVFREVESLTLDEATRWLREVKGWHLSIVINPTYIRKYMFVVVDMNSLHKSRYKYTPDENETTHALAQSAGIDLILKKLDNGAE
jgi:hypothetical protein